MPLKVPCCGFGLKLHQWPPAESLFWGVCQVIMVSSQTYPEILNFFNPHSLTINLSTPPTNLGTIRQGIILTSTLPFSQCFVCFLTTLVVRTPILNIPHKIYHSVCVWQITNIVWFVLRRNVWAQRQKMNLLDIPIFRIFLLIRRYAVI